MNYQRCNDVMAVVGFAPVTRGKTPWNNPNIDVFGVNEEYGFDWWKQDEDKIAGWFQLHKRESFMRPNNHNDPDHAKWLKKKHTFPIFMQEKHKDVPSSEALPIKEITKEFGYYWSSTLAYAVGFAYVAGYKRIELYGFEMASDSEYWGQRANAAYIIGKARGKGMDVYVPPTSRLLTGIRYAYENNLVGMRQDLEVNVTQVRNSKYKIESEAQSLQGEYYLLDELVKTYPELMEEKSKVSVELKKRDNLMHLTLGREQGLSMAIKTFDTYDIIEARGVGV